MTTAFWQLPRPTAARKLRWARRDLNPQGFLRRILSAVRLPIPPLARIGFLIIYPATKTCNTKFVVVTRRYVIQLFVAHWVYISC